jgi:hypothetical protein
MPERVLININEWFESDYVNMCCELEDDTDDPIPSHPTRQATWVLVEDGEAIAAVCSPHYQRLIPR